MHSTRASVSGCTSHHYMQRLQACQTGMAALFGQARQVSQRGLDKQPIAGSTAGTSLTTRPSQGSVLR
jgi:hypothetical protein